MMYYKAVSYSSALSFFLLGSTALADVTPEQVWESWSGAMESYGYQVSAQLDRSGLDLTVSDISMTFQIPEEDASISVLTGPLTLSDKGDGTVDVSFASGMPVLINANEDGDVVGTGTVAYSHSGMSMVASGVPNDITYDMSADVLGLALTNLEVEGDAITTARFKVSMDSVAGRSNLKTGDMRDADQSFSSQAVAYDFAFADPEGGGHVSVKGQMTDLAMQSSATMPLVMDMEDFGAILNAGMAVQAEFSYGGGTTEFAFVDGGDSASGTTSTESGGLTFAMNQDALTYGGNSIGTTLALTASEMPIPVNASIGEVEFSLTMPLAQSTEPKDFGFLYRIVDLSVEEALWGMFDPAGALPHDPASLVIDVAGKGNWLFDIFDPEAAEEMEDAPGELHAVTIRELQLDVAGASLSGTGDFTFDNTDLETFDGMPAPTGKANVKLVGANGLMDALVAMGLIGNEEVMGARAMMGMFARPGDGADTLTSELEVKGDGSVFANGMQLQ